MKCYRKTLRISWTERKKNIEVLKLLKLNEGWLLNTIIRRKLQYFGHLKRHDGIERLILEGRVPGEIRRERPRRQWISDVELCMHMSLDNARLLARNREAFRVSTTKTTFWKEYVTWYIATYWSSLAFKAQQLQTFYSLFDTVVQFF